MRSLSRILLSAIVFVDWATTATIQAQSPTPRLPPSKGKEIIELVMNEELIPTLGLSSISLYPVSNRFAVGMETAIPRRRQFRLEGIDPGWREGEGVMEISVRIFNDRGEQLQKSVESMTGETPGWNGSMEHPVFAHRKTTVIAPPGADSFWIVMTSAGPPDTLGTLLLKGLKVTRTRAGSPPEVVMRAPEGRDSPYSPVQPAPTGFTADGIRPSMARLLTLPPTAPDGKPEDCFALIDDDIGGHAEWRSLKENAVPISEGDHLEVEWQESFSIGEGTYWLQEYEPPGPGTYLMRVRPVDLLGRPDGEETTLSICILPPWWQRGWVWALAAVGTGVLIFCLSRYVAHRRIRSELERMKEVALRKAEVELTRMARATTLGEFTASIVHEICQPLAGITTNANACMRWLSPERSNMEEARAATMRIISDGDRAVKIVTRIRALLAKEKPIRESSSINAVIEELLPLLQSDIRRRGVELDCDLSEDLPPVSIDRVQIQQVIMNLVINGLDAMNGISDRPRLLRIHTARNAEGVLIGVEDTGVGLDPETAARLFERFFTTKSNGLGMGLAICQTIVESHGGRLVAKANQGPGATFQFTLPIETRVIP